MKLTSRTVQRTLAFVNRVRVEHKRKPLKRLPRGRKIDSRGCPIALAIHGRACQWELRVNGDVITPPHYVADFIYAFDNGKIPELEKA